MLYQCSVYAHRNFSTKNWNYFVEHDQRCRQWTQAYNKFSDDWFVTIKYISHVCILFMVHECPWHALVSDPPDLVSRHCLAVEYEPQHGFRHHVAANTSRMGPNNMVCVPNAIFPIRPMYRRARWTIGPNLIVEYHRKSSMRASQQLSL